MIDFEFILTIAAATLSASVVFWLIFLERRPKPLGETRLLPTTPILFICLLILILALAHLVSLVTGAPHVGRFGLLYLNLRFC